MSHDSLANFASCQSSLGPLSGLSRHVYSLQPQTAPTHAIPPSTQGLRRLLVGQLQGPARWGAAVIWSDSFQHSPNSPAHSKGARAGRSMGDLGRQLIQG